MNEKDDKDIWANYASGVQKLGEKKEQSPKQERIDQIKEEIKEKIEAKREEPVLPPPPPPRKDLPRQHEPLDVRVERNLSAGDVFIEARLDLHGKTEQEAFEEYRMFVEQQSGRGRRILLVITGRSGILRTNVPRWTATAPFTNYVQALRTAAPHHGGDGAYYVLLYKRGR